MTSLAAIRDALEKLHSNGQPLIDPLVQLVEGVRELTVAVQEHSTVLESHEASIVKHQICLQQLAGDASDVDGAARDKLRDENARLRRVINRQASDIAEYKGRVDSLHERLKEYRQRESTLVESIAAYVGDLYDVEIAADIRAGKWRQP